MSYNKTKTPVPNRERIVNIQVESSEEEEESETDSSEEETSSQESSSEENTSTNKETPPKTTTQSPNKILNRTTSKSENSAPPKISSSDASTGSEAVPWRKPNLRRVGRQTSTSRRASSDVPAWAEEAKKRLGDVPVESQKAEAPKASDRESEDQSESETTCSDSLCGQSTSESSDEDSSSQSDESDGEEPVQENHAEQTDKMGWLRAKLIADASRRTPPLLHSTSSERDSDEDSCSTDDECGPSASGEESDQSKIRHLESRDRPSAVTSTENGASPWEVKLKPPPPPPPAPVPPPPPPLPPSLLSTMKPAGHGSSQLSEKQKGRLDTLRKTSRRRPDWNELMVEITTPQRRLKKVQCNDRSAPIIKSVKRKDSAFVFESEKVTDADASTKLMKEIKGGIKLKKVKCNDRSRPNLQGLRKLRRQRTSEAFLNLPPEELIDSEPEELDDIDKLRDDLQSTRQLLGEEVKTCERLTKENKHLKNEVKSLQEKLLTLQTERSKNVVENGAEKQNGDTGAPVGEKDGPHGTMTPANSSASEWRHKFEEVEAELALLRSQLANGNSEAASLAVVEKSSPEGGLQRNKSQAKISKSKTKDKLAKSSTKSNIFNKSATQSDQTTASLEKKDVVDQGHQSDNKTTVQKAAGETSDDEGHSEGDRCRVIDEETKRKLRDLKMCKSRISHISTKEKHAKEEQISLKNRIKTLNMSIKDESRKYKELEREVHKLGSVMKGSDGESDMEEDDESDDEDSSEDEESESSSDEESSDESETDNEDLSIEERLKMMQDRAKRHDDNEKAIKKGNYMLRTTAERLFDKLRNEKERYRVLEHELSSLVNEMA